MRLGRLPKRITAKQRVCSSCLLLLLVHGIPSVAHATVHCLTILGNETRKAPQADHRQTTRVLLLLGHGIPSVAHATVHCLTILGNETRKGPQAVHRQTTRVLLLLGHGIPSV